MDIGILQGRLSPSSTGKLQFFPDNWANEFAVAKDMGFSGIEWLIDKSTIATNPALHDTGRIGIRQAMIRFGVPVVSLHGVSPRIASPCELLLLIQAASMTRQRVLVMPLLEDNAPKDAQDEAIVRAQIMPFLPIIEMLGVHLAFETEMPQERLAQFIDSFESPLVGALYDIGNCTSYGFNCPADIRALGSRIKGVHVKDRKIGSSQSVTLGTGDADICGCARALIDIGWHGTLIMQAWRTPKTYLQDAHEQLAYLRKIVEEVENE